MNGVLHDLLMENLFGVISIKDGRRFARLKETGVDAKLKQVDIYDVPEGSLLINLDAYEQPKSLFKGQKGERQRCDYVLVTRIDDQPFLVFIEMKSAALKDSDISRQFKGSECVLDYCDVTLDRFHGQNGFLRQFNKRFVVFYRPRLAKQRTRLGKPPRGNDSPERALKYPSPHNPSLKTLVAL
jgi:hypothetical protein